jgi:hypothetical protein
MAGVYPCPQCGADNDEGTRRCRLCAALLDAAVAEVVVEPKGLPEHIQRRIDQQAVGGAHDEHTYVPDHGGAASAVAPGGPGDHGGGAGEHFDTGALLRDMGREHLPAPPVRPPAPDELRSDPFPPPGPDPLWAAGADLGPDASSADIERVSREALRQERVRNRPRFLDKMFKAGRDEPVDDADL